MKPMTRKDKGYLYFTWTLALWASLFILAASLID